MFKKLDDSDTDSGERKVMILHGFSNKEINIIFELLKNNESLKKTIVAVTTPVSIEWKIKDLIGELLLEDEALKNKK
ncbi:MAG: DUF3783 domain-containing protein [Thermoplasmata archaeon]